MTPEIAALGDGYDVLALDPGHEGACPCFYATVPYRIEGHCWRTCHGAECCLHTWGPAEDAKRMKELLDEMNWYGKWLVVMETEE